MKNRNLTHSQSMMKDGEKEIWYSNLLGLWALHPRAVGSHSMSTTYCPAYFEELTEVTHKVFRVVLTVNFIEFRFTWEMGPEQACGELSRLH